MDFCVSCVKGSLLLLVKVKKKTLWYEPNKESGYLNVRECVNNSRSACVMANLTTPPIKICEKKYFAFGGLCLMDERLYSATGI